MSTLFNSTIIVSAKAYAKINKKTGIRETVLDKKGKPSVWLTCLSGKMPNRNILAGSIAESEGIEAGESYMLSVQEKESSPEYGRQFNFTFLKKLSFIELIQATGPDKPLGEPEVFSVDAVVEQPQENKVFAKSDEKPF